MIAIELQAENFRVVFHSCKCFHVQSICAIVKSDGTKHLFGKSDFFFESLFSDSRKWVVWHVENKSETTLYSGARAGIEIFFVGRARFAQMRMHINKSGKFFKHKNTSIPELF